MNDGRVPKKVTGVIFGITVLSSMEGVNPNVKAICVGACVIAYLIVQYTLDRQGPDPTLLPKE